MSPVIFVIKNTGIEIYNAFAYEKNKQKLQPINISDQERDNQFSFWNLQSGSTWKWLQTAYYEDRKQKETQKRVYQRLFDNIKDVRATLITNGLLEEDANILILRIIFIRYLIDRNINIDNVHISGKTTIEKRFSFLDLLQSERKLTNFFIYLNGRFNGVLFKDVSIKLAKKNLDFLTNIFDIRADKTTPTLFDQFYFDIYDFSIIPVEVISGIYESLMDPETRELNAAVYTPAFLVDYILNETVSDYLQENKTSECKIFDPSCGSGIFLVQSLRRMIDKEIELYGAKIKTKKFSDRIREIATNNIFGVDINPEALKVTCFSIYIALLDYQEPKDIDKYEFPGLLDKNLFATNFFNLTHPFNEVINQNKIQFILGNPPWGNGGKDNLHKTYLKKHKLEDVISDNQLAQSFTLRTKDFSTGTTNCCLILTSKAIYNINAERFRKYFLKNFFLTKCFDLSPVRRLIFEGADNPAMVLHFSFANEESTLSNVVLHQSLKYNIYLKYFKALVIEKNDTKKIKQQFFYENNWMFKVALYGGVLDYFFITKLNFQRTPIEKFLKDKYSIEAGNGIQKGNAKDYFDDLIGLPIIETNDVKEYYTPITDNTKLLTKRDVYLERGRNSDLYKGNKILITRRPKKETNISISMCHEDAVFRDSVYGIPFKNNKIISQVYSLLISDLYIYYQYLITSNWGIYHPEINKAEYLSFPYQEMNKEMADSISNLVKDFIKPIKSYYKSEIRTSELPISKQILAEINKAIYTAYNIKPFEVDLIDYVVNIARYQFQGEEKQKILTDFTFLEHTHYRNINLVLKDYANVIIDEFKVIYLNGFVRADIYVLNRFIAMNFVFMENKPKQQIRIITSDEISDESNLFSLIAQSISVSQIAQELFIQKDIKGFEENSFYIIKPKEYKCWHKAMAWYDVAEIKEKIQSSELERLKNTF